MPVLDWVRTDLHYLLPSGGEVMYFDFPTFVAFDAYREIGRDKLRQHLSDFIQAVVPVAEETGINMAIHPDDPPFPVLGLPRIVSTKEEKTIACRCDPTME